MEFVSFSYKLHIDVFDLFGNLLGHLLEIIRWLLIPTIINENDLLGAEIFQPGCESFRDSIRTLMAGHHHLKQKAGKKNRNSLVHVFWSKCIFWSDFFEKEWYRVYVGPCRNTVRVDSEGNWVPFIKVNRLFAYCCTVLATPKRYLLLLDEISNSVYCMLGENSKHKWERLQKWSMKQNHVKQIKSYSYVLQELWVVLPGFLLIVTWPRDKGH